MGTTGRPSRGLVGLVSFSRTTITVPSADQDSDGSDVEPLNRFGTSTGVRPNFQETHQLSFFVRGGTMKFNSGGSKLGVLGFYAASHKAEQCGANGKAPPFAPPSFFPFS